MESKLLCVSPLTVSCPKTANYKHSRDSIAILLNYNTNLGRLEDKIHINWAKMWN